MPVRLEELTHSPEILRGVARHAGIAALEGLSQGRDGPPSPLLGGDFPVDVLADIPIEIDQRGVDGRYGPRPRGLDEPEHNVEIGLSSGWRRGRPG